MTVGNPATGIHGQANDAGATTDNPSVQLEVDELAACFDDQAAARLSIQAEYNQLMAKHSRSSERLRITSQQLKVAE